MKDIIYFDNAATTFPKPPQVIDEIGRCMREYCGNPGRGSHTLAVAAAEKLYECREAAAQLLGAPSAESVVFTYNTTYAINTALKGYVPHGSHILISDMEHNAVFRPVSELARRGAITYDIFGSGGGARCVTEEIKRKLRPNTAAVVCTLASNICSAELPSREIGLLCREHGILFIADGAQAVGHRAISMKNEHIDILCAPAHKGLYGPQGIGMMISAADREGVSVIEGGSGFDSKNPEMPRLLPERYEAGTQNTPAAAGLAEGIGFVRNIGIGNIAAMERELWIRLYSRVGADRRFTVYGERRPSSLMLLNKRGMSASELGRALAERGICTRSGFHCAPLAHKTIGTGENGGVRISFGVFNTPGEVDVLCDALLKA